MRRTFFRAWALLALTMISAPLTGCKRARAVVRQHTAAGRAEAAARSARIQRGRGSYVRYCALCHGARGQGYAADHANALANQDFLQVATRDFLRDAIENGRPGTPMSAWGRARGGPLDEGSVNDLVFYLRSLARRPMAPRDDRASHGSVASGRTLWNTHCLRCHGPRGEGTQIATSVSNPNFLRAASDGYLRWTLNHGRAGTPMASFASLGPAAIDDLIAFVRSVEHTPGPPPPTAYEAPPGLDQLVMHPTGRAPAFTLRAGRFVPGAQVERALREGRRMIILDARATSDWARGHITGALPFPFYSIEEMARRIPRDGTWVLAYCSCPHAASGHVVDELRARGFENTAVIDEGYPWWVEHGYPTAQAAERAR
jgi:cytochrome c oxidase cbb3-type subunit 3